MRQCSVCYQIQQLKVTVLYTFNLKEDILSVYTGGISLAVTQNYWFYIL